MGPHRIKGDVKGPPGAQGRRLRGPRGSTIKFDWSFDELLGIFANICVI